MSRPGAGGQVPEDAAHPPARAADTGIRAAAGLTVVVLAGIAGAISYSHMRVLAEAHGETGWQAHTFPLSVDGIEVVASLVLLGDRSTGRRSGWLPWAALAAGMTASLAANVLAVGSDLIGRVVAGWPAFAFLIAVKLLSQLLESRRDADRPADAHERPAAAEDGPDRMQDRPPSASAGDDFGTPAGPAPKRMVNRTNGQAGTARPASMRAVPHLVPNAGAGDAAGTGTINGDGDNKCGRSRDAARERDGDGNRDGDGTRHGDGSGAQCRRAAARRVCCP